MVSESWPPSSSSLLRVPRSVSLPSFLLIFSTPSIFGQPSWLVCAGAADAVSAAAQAATAAIDVRRMRIGLPTCNVATQDGRRPLGDRHEAAAVAIERDGLALTLGEQRRRRDARPARE